MRKTIKKGDLVIIQNNITDTVYDIQEGRYYFEGVPGFFTASEVVLVKDAPKEIKRTPIKKKSAGPLHKQTAPGEKPIEKKLYKIRQISKNQAKLNAIYNKMHGPYLEKRLECAVKSKNCTFYSQEIHHKKGRIGQLLITESNFLPICQSCHHFININSKQAIELGFSERRNC